MKFINHWLHSHFIILGIQWGGGFRISERLEKRGSRTIEVTILNLGVEFKRKEPDLCEYDD